MNDLETLHPDRSKWQVAPWNSSVLNPVLPKEHVGTRVSSLIKKPLSPEKAWYLSIDDKDDRTKELVDVMLTSAFENLDEQEKVVSWANEAFERYGRLPEGTIGQKIIVKEFVRKTAIELLENVQHINIVDETWRRLDAQRADTGEPRVPFSQRVKKDSLTSIGEKWKDVEPEQLAQLVRIYAKDNDPSQEFAKAMLTEYFKGPSDKPERSFSRSIAREKIVSATLDLIGEDEAFREGMKIVLYATDILPRDPGLIEQANMLSLPSKKEEKRDEFKKLLILEHVTKQAIAMSSQDFTEYIEANIRYVRTETKSKIQWHERKKRADAERRPSEAEKKNLQIRAAVNVFLKISRMPWSEEGIEKLRKMDPLYEKAFDPTDPLNQKLKRVLSENRSRSGVNAQSRLEEVASIK